MHRTHGRAGTREHIAWKGMKTRCNNPKATGYRRWGGRGIKVFPAWDESFEAFFAYMGPCPDGHSIDRIDNEKGYEPGNCRWADRRTQMLNCSRNLLVTHEGKTQPLRLWTRELGLDYDRTKARIRYGMTSDMAFSSELLPRGNASLRRVY